MFSIFVKIAQQSILWRKRFCENCTRKTPLYIYYIISQSANAACIILAFWYYVGVLDRVRATKKRGTEHKRMNRTQCAGRLRWQYCRRWRGGITPGEKFKCKGVEQTEIHFQMCACVRGYYGGLPAIRAHKVAQAAPMRGTFQKVYDLLTIIINNE